jgi:hypothetical protein
VDGGEAGTALNGAKRSEGIAEAKAEHGAARPERQRGARPKIKK